MFCNYNPCFALLLTCLTLTQICLINSTVNHNQNSNVKRMISKEIVGKSDLINNNKNYYKDFGIDTNSNIELKDRVSEPDLKLYGYASMVDPRAPVAHKHKILPNNQQMFSQNSYQQLFDSFKLGDGLQDAQGLQGLQEMHRMPGHPMLPNPNHPNADEETLKILKNYLKKYDMKRYFLKKILGDSYENEEGHEEGFFANKHLRRHGAAGMAGKVFGELIGIKIRKSIEGFGDTISDYAKEFTTNGFVSIGNKFNKLFRGA